MENKWVEDFYNREAARLQPILDAIDASPNGSIEINGYVCNKKLGKYNIGAEKDGNGLGGMIEVSPEKEHRGDNGTYKSKGVLYHVEDVPLGGVTVSSLEEQTRVRDVGLYGVPENLSKNTILENALEYHQRSLTRQDRLIDGDSFCKEMRDSIQKILVMLKSLGVELTPEENMAFLRGRKEELETELSQVNEQLNQKDSQQK